MPTERQPDAHRLNSLKSGLDADSQFVYGESREEFAQLQREYFDRFLPTSPDERFLVDTLIRNEWTLRRLFRAEAHLWEYLTMRASRSDGVPLGEALNNGSGSFMRLQRRITLAERSYKEAFQDLQRLQVSRQPAQTAPPETADPPDPPLLSTPQPEPTTEETQQLALFLTPAASPARNGRQAAEPAAQSDAPQP